MGEKIKTSVILPFHMEPHSHEFLHILWNTYPPNGFLLLQIPLDCVG
jgi:hypothetical protein